MKKIEIVYRKPNEIKSDFGNPRTISKKELTSLKKSIETLGDFGVIVIDELNNVISGNQRVKAMNELGINIPIACKQLTGYTDAEKKAINIRANKSSGEFDEELLNEWLKDISIELEDIDLTGFDDLVDFSEKNQEIMMDSLDDEMVVKLKYSEEKYNDIMSIKKEKKINIEEAFYEFIISL